MSFYVKLKRPLAPSAIQGQLFPKDFSTLDSEIFTLCGRLVWETKAVVIM